MSLEDRSSERYMKWQNLKILIDQLRNSCGEDTKQKVREINKLSTEYESKYNLRFSYYNYPGIER